MDNKLQEDKGGGEDGADPPKTSPVRPGPGRGQKLRTWREIARLGVGKGRRRRVEGEVAIFILPLECGG